MAAYVVMEKAGSDTPAESVAFVRDGFHWLAFLVPIFWLLWHRLWIEAALAFGVTVLLSAAGEFLGLGVYASLLTLLVSLYFGLEGATLRIRALGRRGWREWGVLDASRLADAELLYAGGDVEEAEGSEAPLAPQPTVASSAAPRRSATHGIGLVPYPGRS